MRKGPFIQNSNFKISEKFTNQDWLNLKLQDQNSVGWEIGIDIIEDRFNSRFFKHIDKIKDDKFSGFAVMALDCLVIETLMQFYLGKDDSNIAFAIPVQCYVQFFLTSNYFPGLNSVELCIRFYNGIRNGLLHQAQTKENCRLRVGRSAMVEEQNNLLILDRKHFHKAIEYEFKDYIQSLKDNVNNYKNENFRLNAITKMGFIVNETP